MKVLFINVSKRWQGRVYREYPYGIGILATIAHNHGHEVRILDMALDAKTPKDIIDEFKPDVIGLSFMSTSLNVANNLINDINSIYTGHLIAGGVHCSLYPEDVIKQGVDLVVIGEGENIIIPLLKYLERSEPKCHRDENLKHIPSLAYRNIKGEIVKTFKNNESVDLDAIPIINRELFDMNLYAHHSILTSRRCPYQCRFCCSWAPGGRAGRTMSTERIIEELEYLVEHYGPIKLFWADEIFFWNINQRLEFLNALKAKRLPIEFTIQLRTKLITEQLVDALIECGCVKICIGAESGSEQILKTSNKQIDINQIEEGIKICVDKGLRIKTWWIVGLPGGGVDDQLAALDLIEKTKPNEVAIHHFVPIPGTEFWNKSNEYGINLPDESLYDHLNYYSKSNELTYNYITNEEIFNILKEYEQRLLSFGYIPTDEADESTAYVFTTPFQNTTFKI